MVTYGVSSRNPLPWDNIRAMQVLVFGAPFRRYTDTTIHPDPAETVLGLETTLPIQLGLCSDCTREGCQV